MLPKTGDILRADFTIRKQPSKTYRLKDGRVIGNVEDMQLRNYLLVEAVTHSIDKGVHAMDLTLKGAGISG